MDGLEETKLEKFAHFYNSGQIALYMLPSAEAISGPSKGVRITMCDLTWFYIFRGLNGKMKQALEKLSNNLTHIVSGILDLLVLGSWGDCAHTDTDKSLSTMLTPFEVENLPPSACYK